MERTTEIIITILRDKTASEIANCLKAIKIMHKLKYHIEIYKEVNRNKIYNLVLKDNKLVENIARKMGLTEIKRKTSAIAKRPGRAWVMKRKQ